MCAKAPCPLASYSWEATIGCTCSTLSQLLLMERWASTQVKDYKFAYRQRTRRTTIDSWTMCMEFSNQLTMWKLMVSGVGSVVSSVGSVVSSVGSDGEQCWISGIS